MAQVRFLHGISRQEAQGVDRRLIDLAMFAHCEALKDKSLFGLPPLDGAGAQLLTRRSGDAATTAVNLHTSLVQDGGTERASARRHKQQPGTAMAAPGCCYEFVCSVSAHAHQGAP